MAHLSILTALVLLSLTGGSSSIGPLPPGIWSNAEDAYFAEEAGRERPDTIFVEVDENGRWRRINAFGEAQGGWTSAPIPGLERSADGSGWRIAGSEIRRARPFACWVALRKFAAKPDGSEDWVFVPGLKTFDQGGRVRVSGKGLAPDVTLRLRHVLWPKNSSNKPSLVLYVHKDDPDRAASYAWTSPDAGLVGINLRWVQASCSRLP